MIIQCDLGGVTGDLIACARYRIYDLKAKADEEQRTHVLFVIHLTHQAAGAFVGFQGDPWVSYHIDDLSASPENTVSASQAIALSLIELFRGQAGPKEGANDADGEEEECENEEEESPVDHEADAEEEDIES